MQYSQNEIIFYSGVWLLAFAAACVRVLRDHDYKHVGDVLAVGCAGGLFGFGTVCMWVGHDSSALNSPWYFWGVAALIGLLGKEQDKYVRAMMSSVMKKIGIEDNQNRDRLDGVNKEDDRDTSK